MLAGNEGLHSLTAIVDCNGLQASGHVAEIAPLEPLAAKWQAFGWQVLETDGQDLEALRKSIAEAHAEHRQPTAVLARTVKGKGFPAAEDRADWHSRRPTVDEWLQVAGALGMTQEELMTI